MREVAFLKQNSEKWKSFEALLKNPKKESADTIADLYIKISNDLAFAQSNYPESKTTAYLNELAIKAHNTLYRNKRADLRTIIDFWKKDIPEIFSRHQKELLISFIVFLVAISIGVTSSLLEDSFFRSILGDRYVNMTIDNIQNDDPLAVYKDEHAMNMFMGITINNIRVSFMAFIFGLFTSVGTGLLLFNNGIMVGAFMQFFGKYALLKEAFLVVFIHGTLELSAIVIAGAAGFVMGNSLLFPGTYSRYESFLKGAKEGAKMVFALVPIFITAGFLESFVTRHTEMPVWLSLGIIGVSAIFIVYYFVILPHRILKDKHGKQYG
jgi:uncharacterized membrane protein SpoIIM required for sporulation